MENEGRTIGGPGSQVEPDNVMISDPVKGGVDEGPDEAARATAAEAEL